MAALWATGPSWWAACTPTPSAGGWFHAVPGLEPADLTQWLAGLLLSGLGVGMVLSSLTAAR